MVPRSLCRDIVYRWSAALGNRSKHAHTTLTRGTYCQLGAESSNDKSGSNINVCLARYLKVAQFTRIGVATSHRPMHPKLSSLPRRVCCSWPCAMPVQHAKPSEQARKETSPLKNTCDKQVSSWRHISCHTDKNRYYT